MSFSPISEASYFIAEKESNDNELWMVQDATGRMLTYLRPNPAAPVFKDNLLVLHYDDGEAFMLNLELLAELGDDISAISPDELIRLACKHLFAPGKFDASKLEPYLDDKPQACNPLTSPR